MNQKRVSFESITGKKSNSTVFSLNEIESLSKERILVTGAGGSIGSEIIEFLSKIDNVVYLATDRDEGALHSLSLKLSSTALFDSQSILLLDLRDSIGIRRCIEDFRPTMVIHAGALKHLSALQRQPREAILTNVFGTANLVEISAEFNVKKFVNISTDKAAEPTSVLGFSKKLAELYVCHYRAETDFEYTSCRFGNVFNSRGSVIETFTYQIYNKKPITLTDKNINRYFMSIEEAAHLTLKSVMLNAGDVHVFDMGEPIPLSEIVENLQEVIGLRTSIIITGLRDGEKNSEVLFSSLEKPNSTLDPKITFVSLRKELDLNRNLVSCINKRDEQKLLYEVKKYTNSDMS
jgi:FlaA1/EpsC-like NDP-sugar epimerase